MSPDQEVSDDALPRSTSSPVGSPRLTGTRCRGRTHGGELDAQSSQGFVSCVGGREEADGLGPDDFARDDTSLVERTLERSFRTRTEPRIGAKDVEENARVDGGDQTVSALPRTRRISSSVRRRSLRMP